MRVRDRRAPRRWQRRGPCRAATGVGASRPVRRSHERIISATFDIAAAVRFWHARARASSALVVNTTPCSGARSGASRTCLATWVCSGNEVRMRTSAALTRELQHLRSSRAQHAFVTRYGGRSSVEIIEVMADVTECRSRRHQRQGGAGSSAARPTRRCTTTVVVVPGQHCEVPIDLAGRPNAWPRPGVGGRTAPALPVGR